MQLIQLETVKHRLCVGTPLPFNVRGSGGALLLARGQVVGSAEQLDSLFERGMLVDIAELQTPREQVASAPRQALPALWQRSIDGVANALHALPDNGFDAVLDEVAAPLLALIEREPDLAIFQVLREHGSRHAQYGVNHSIHCAIAAFVAAQRLGYDAQALQRAFKAALTMNVSILELQGKLATQHFPPTAAQREQIDSHPRRSVVMLQLAGISDALWLAAVAHHHAPINATGTSAALATLLHHCDVYTAKLSPRHSREALRADIAARGLFASYPGDPVATALIKEFGVYPPGCFVKLASGESGIVVRRGPNAHTPQVALMSARGNPSPSEPARRDTSRPEHAIVAVLGADAAPPGMTAERLAALVCA